MVALEWSDIDLVSVNSACSDRVAPARAIRELAGHKDLSTSQRYMHLSPAAIESAIRPVEQPAFEKSRGDILATGIEQIEKSSG